MLFEDRGRAGSFGEDAEQYHRMRPSYPPALVDDLLALGVRRVLDVGCGTGIAGSLFRERGCEVSAQAWHWINPSVGPAKAGRALRSGGVLAAVWNLYHHDPLVAAALIEVHERLAPGLARDSLPLGTIPAERKGRRRMTDSAAIEACGAFESPASATTGGSGSTEGMSGVPSSRPTAATGRFPPEPGTSFLLRSARSSKLTGVNSSCACAPTC